MPGIATILIADDEVSFREATRRLLEREGFECHHAEDAGEAIERLRDRQFDLLIADIRMPHNENLRLVREAQELNRDMAIIVVTGYPSTETAIQSVELPVTAYMTKPLDFDELLGHVDTAVKLSKRRQGIAAAIERLRTCLKDLENVSLQGRYRKEGNGDVPAATIRTLAACLSELLTLSEKENMQQGEDNLCELLDSRTLSA